KKIEVKRVLKLNLFIALFLFITLIVVTPFTPLYKNTYAHLDLLGIDYNKPPNDTEKANTPNDDNNVSPPISSKEVENLLLSSRDVYLKMQQDYYKSSSIYQKLIGMGYAGNYTELPKMIEM